MFDLYKRELIYATKQKKLKKTYFAECFYLGTRQSVHFQDAGKGLCRVPSEKHSAKPPSLPRARSNTHGKARAFAECPVSGTRQSWRLCRVSSVWHSTKLAHSVGGRPFCFILPSASWHTVKLCRVPEKMHSAKLALSSDCLPSVCC